jgi:NADH dehydrogenase
MAPVFVDDVARLVADSLVDDAARNQVFELGGPETMRMRDVIARTLRVAGLRRALVPAPPPLIKLAAAVMQFLPGRPLTPEAVDFINQPAETDTGPLLDRMPRRLTTLEEGLRSYLVPRSSG